MSLLLDPFTFSLSQTLLALDLGAAVIANATAIRAALPPSAQSDVTQVPMLIVDTCDPGTAGACNKLQHF